MQAKALLLSGFFRMFSMERAAFENEGDEAVISLKLVEKDRTIKEMADRLHRTERAYDNEATKMQKEHETKVLFLLDHIQQLSFPKASAEGKQLSEQVLLSRPSLRRP